MPEAVLFNEEDELVLYDPNIYILWCVSEAVLFTDEEDKLVLYDPNIYIVCTVGMVCARGCSLHRRGGQACTL